MDSKPCTKCGVVKLLGDFQAEARNRDGFRGACRACCNKESSTAAKRYRERHANEIRRRQRERYQRAPSTEERKKYNRDYYQKNATQIRLATAAYARAHPEMMALARRQWAENNPGLLARSKAAYRKANPDKVLADARLSRQSLRNDYVTQVLRVSHGLSAEQISDDLIEKKRTALAVHRSIRAIETTLKELKK